MEIAPFCVAWYVHLIIAVSSRRYPIGAPGSRLDSIDYRAIPSRRIAFDGQSVRTHTAHRASDGLAEPGSLTDVASGVESISIVWNHALTEELGKLGATPVSRRSPP
jgi:hypothetical protein